MSQSGAQLFASCLVNQGVTHVFAIPGAKIDALFNALLDTPIELIVCRHEQNATFAAAAYGRSTGRPGVVLVTSGPGVSNLATGLLTAHTEGDPVVAIGGNVPRNMRYKASHQSADNAKLLKAATGFSEEVLVVDQIPEIVENAFRSSIGPVSGASFISIPQDVLTESTSLVAPEKSEPVNLGDIDQNSVDKVVSLMAKSKSPVLFLGQEASRPEVAAAVRGLLHHHPLAVVGSYQAAGAISRDLAHCFAGRVGLFANQPGDQLLEDADCVITIGFNPVEYDPEIWNKNADKSIIHLHYQPCDIHFTYQPKIECIGNLPSIINSLKQVLPSRDTFKQQQKVTALTSGMNNAKLAAADNSSLPIHPLRFIHDLRQWADDDTLVVCDIGSIYMWMARYFWSYQPRKLFFSNGQQTLGVALPWAIGAYLANPQQKIVSMSGDGGFLFSAMELETAVRIGANFTHFVWCDGEYNMVKEQQLLKYGRPSAVELGHLDIVKFAESFGASGFKLHSADDITSILDKANAIKGPVLVEVPIDYKDNPSLFKQVHEHKGN